MPLRTLVLLAVAGTALSATANDPPELRLTAAKPQPRPKGGLIAHSQPGKDGGRVQVLTPHGDEFATVSGFEKNGGPLLVRWSHDGTRLAVLAAHTPDKLKPDDLPASVLVYDLTAPGRPVATFGPFRHAPTPTWGGDTTTLYVNDLVEQKNAKEGEWKLTHRVTKYDVGTGKGTPVNLPMGHSVHATSPDGKTLLVQGSTPLEGGGSFGEAYLADAATLELKRITQSSVSLLHFSPDGTKLLGTRSPDPKDRDSRELVVVDLKAGTESVVDLGDAKTNHPVRAVWSADGSRLLVYRLVVVVQAGRPQRVGDVVYLPKSKPELTLRDPDGSNVKPFLPEVKDGWFDFDWR